MSQASSILPSRVLLLMRSPRVVLLFFIAVVNKESTFVGDVTWSLPILKSFILRVITIFVRSLKYYFTSSGIYKVGRKDCAVTIQADKTVSRLHAEIQLEDTCLEPKNLAEGQEALDRPRIVLKDLSKFGSFVNKTAGSKPVFSLPNKEVNLNEGDLLTFGTDNSTFKLEYLSILVYVLPLADQNKKDAVTSAVASSGGRLLERWCEECTHVLVEDGSYVTDVVIEAVAQRKPVVGTSWIEAIASRSSISSEFPSLSRFTPNMLFKVNEEIKLLKIVEPNTRLSAFLGVTFYVGSMYLYTYKSVLQGLVEACGGRTITIGEISKSRVSQMHQDNLNGFLIVPTLEPKLQRWLSSEELKLVSNVRKTSEAQFVAAVLSGENEPECFALSSSPAASASSDETIEAVCSDGPHDELVSEHVKESAVQHHKQVCSPLLEVGHSAKKLGLQQGSSCSTFPSAGKHSVSSVSTRAMPTSKEKFKDVQKQSMPSMPNYGVANTEDGHVTLLEGDLGASKADVEFSKHLIIHRVVVSEKPNASSVQLVQNFKRFKRKHDTSGNSFTSLVPFAKEPFRESEYNKEIQEYLQQEKKRKEDEALADDLFNRELMKRQKRGGRVKA